MTTLFPAAATELPKSSRAAGVDRKTFYALLKRGRESQGGESIPQEDAETEE